MSSVTQRPIPEEAFTRAPIDKPAGDATGPEIDRPRKLHPKLDALARTRPGHDYTKVVVVFEDDVAIPRMPFLDASQSRDSEENRARLSAIQAQVEAIKARRVPRYAAMAHSLNRDFGATRIEQSYWLINEVSADVPVAALEGISRRPDVVYVQPEQSDDPPPNLVPNNVSHGRSRIASDAYYSFTGGYIGLLDTGIRPTHVLLSGPQKYSLVFDCTDGTCGANGSPTDTVNHGTSSVAILTGNSNLTNAFRGVTNVTVDSFNVYGTTDALNINAAVLGFQAAVNWGDRVIVAEMQANEDVTGAVATAADNAFDANRIVVAVNRVGGERGKKPLAARQKQKMEDRT